MANMTPKQALDFAKQNKAQFVDLKFNDFLGIWQQFTIPIDELSEAVFEEGLGFDGSSIRGFTAQRESDLRLGVDWGAFYYAPADYFGSGKVLVFGEVIDKDGTPYAMPTVFNYTAIGSGARTRSAVSGSASPLATRFAAVPPGTSTACGRSCAAMPQLSNSFHR